MTDHYLTEDRAAKMWDGVPESVYVHGFDEADRVIQDHTLAAMQAAYAAGRADASDDSWEPFDWDETPASIGDEVEVTVDPFGLTSTRRGVIVSFDGDGDPCFEDNGLGLIGQRDYGTWRVRRNPIDPLADLAPGTVIRDATIVGAGPVGNALISTDINGLCVVSARHRASLSKLTEFTTEDRTICYTQHGDTWIAKNPNEETDD